MELSNYKVEEEIFSPEKFPLDESARYFRRVDQNIESVGLYENDDIDSLPALPNLRRSSGPIRQ